MPYLNKEGLDALWDHIKDNFGHSLSKTPSSTAVDINLVKAGGTTLSTVTLGSATTSNAGLMTTTDKAKLDGIATGANNYTHPAGSAAGKSSGLYKIATDSTSHVSGLTAVTKSDITNLGIPSADTHYTSKNVVGSTSSATANAKTDNGSTYLNSVENGAVTSANLIKGTGATTVTSAGDGTITINSTDTKYTLPTASASTLGGVKVGTNLSIDSSGVLSADSGTDEKVKTTVYSAVDYGPDTQLSLTATTATEEATGELVSIPMVYVKGKQINNTILPFLHLNTYGVYLGSDEDVMITAANYKGKANLASPTFTGTPTAPTAAAGTSSTQIATTAFVSNAIASEAVGHAKYQGGITPTTYAALKSYKQGWYWVVTTAGTIAGETCEIGDMVFCNTDSASGATAPTASHFDVVQNNIDAIEISYIQNLS